jgi:hypothetical protein
VSCRGAAFLVAPIGIGALLVALATMHAAAQSGAPAGMRSTIEGDADTAAPRRTKKQTKSTTSTPAGQLPSFAVPAARGAGKTGFVSTNIRRKAKRRPGERPSDAAESGVQLLPSGTLLIPGQPLSGEKPKPKAKAPPAAKTKSAQTPAKPAAPGAASAQASRAQLVQARDAQAREQPNGQPVPPVLLRKKLVVEHDPFDQLGIRAGAFLLRPAIETVTGYDSNPARVSGGRGSAFVSVAPELFARSDWQRHQLTADIRGSYTAYEATPEENRPFLDARVAGRVDVTERSRIDLEGRYRVSTDNPGSPNIQAGLAELPIFTTIGGSAGVAHRFNRFELAVKGSAERTEYDDSVLTDGTIVTNAGRNYNQYGAHARASYELLPTVRPFAQVDVDTRIYDLPIDAGGVPRDSDGIAGRVGTTFDMSRLLTGEVAIGYLTRVYKDPTLPNLEGLLLDASLVWVPTGLTTVKLNARTSADESTLAGVSGVLTRNVSLQVDHAFRRWLIGTVRVGYGLDDYVGSVREDDRYIASAGITYKLTRAWHVKGELRQEWLKSNVPGNDYTATIAQVGLRWQP